MPSLFTSLMASSDALKAYEKALSIVQNNVSNAHTPGFAKQRAVFQSRPFDIGGGLQGGVLATGIQSSRSHYAEQHVWRELHLFQRDSQRLETLSRLEEVLDISGQGGIAKRITDLVNSFSAWSAAPNDTIARQNVIDQAGRVAEEFKSLTSQLERAGVQAERNVRDNIKQINALGEKLAQLNVERRRGAQNDPGIDSSIHATLEELSQLTGFNAYFTEDGAVTVLLGGRAQLVVGSHFYGLQAEMTADAGAPFPAAASRVRITAEDGQDVTAYLTQGRLGGLLEFRNKDLAVLRGGPTQQGDLNRLAQAFADRVNGILTAGVISEGPPPVAGVPLFQYEAARPELAASTLAINPAITPDQLAAIQSGPPKVSNGVAKQLGELLRPQQDADKIDGFSFVEFYGKLAGDLGYKVSAARHGKEAHSELVLQARHARQEISGVSLDEEAIYLIQFQRAFQANAQMVKTLNELTQSALDLLR